MKEKAFHQMQVYSRRAQVYRWVRAAGIVALTVSVLNAFRVAGISDAQDIMPDHMPEFTTASCVKGVLTSILLGASGALALWIGNKHSSRCYKLMKHYERIYFGR